MPLINKITVDGVSLDDIFDPYEVGTKTCPEGRIFMTEVDVVVTKVDIRNRYAPLAQGEKAPDTGVEIDGVDISNYFAAAGTSSSSALVVSPWNGNQFSESDNQDSKGHAECYILFTMKRDGTYEIKTGDTGIPTTLRESGTWLQDTTVSPYEVRVDFSHSGNIIGSTPPVITSSGMGTYRDFGLDRTSLLNIATDPDPSRPSVSVSATLTVSIRDTRTGEVEVSTIKFTASMPGGSIGGT